MILAKYDLVTYVKDISPDEEELFLTAFDCEVAEVLKRLSGRYGFSVALEESK